MFLWFGGVVAVWSPLPLPLCLKLAPILFDSLLAVLVFDLANRLTPRVAFRAGLLYATSPVALLITSFHGQWDAIALFFLLLAFGVREGGDSLNRREACFGAFFGLSLLIKPIALPFLLLFPRRRSEVVRSDWQAATSPLLTLLAGFGISTACGYSPADILIGITSNSVKGVQVFGLPFAPILSNLPLQSFRLFWIIPIMVFLAALYHRGSLGAADTMLLFSLLTLGTAGISPQYLLWPLPFLLISARLRLTLRGVSWLLPPAALAKPELLPWVHASGNVLLPICTLTIAVLVFRSGWRQARDQRIQSGWSMGRTVGYLIPASLFAAIILFVKLMIQESDLSTRLSEIWKAIPAQYALHVQSWAPAVMLSGDFGRFGEFNVIVLLALLAAIWCAAALRANLTRSP